MGRFYAVWLWWINIYYNWIQGKHGLYGGSSKGQRPVSRPHSPSVDAKCVKSAMWVTESWVNFAVERIVSGAKDAKEDLEFLLGLEHVVRFRQKCTICATHRYFSLVRIHYFYSTFGDSEEKSVQVKACRRSDRWAYHLIQAALSKYQFFPKFIEVWNFVDEINYISISTRI